MPISYGFRFSSQIIEFHQKCRKNITKILFIDHWFELPVVAHKIVSVFHSNINVTNGKIPWMSRLQQCFRDCLLNGTCGNNKNWSEQQYQTFVLAFNAWWVAMNRNQLFSIIAYKFTSATSSFHSVPLSNAHWRLMLSIPYQLAFSQKPSNELKESHPPERIVRSTDSLFSIGTVCNILECSRTKRATMREQKRMAAKGGRNRRKVKCICCLNNLKRRVEIWIAVFWCYSLFIFILDAAWRAFLRKPHPEH